MKIYLVGFYSPIAKSGVTETSLTIYNWLKKNTTLSVAFISYGTLEKEKPSEELIHEFSKLALVEQRRKMKKMKKEFDIIIFDASSQLSDEVLKLIPIVDRLFIVGEEHTEIAVKLHQMIHFNRTFDNHVKTFISHLNGNKTYIIRENEHNRVIGFNSLQKETTDIAQMVYTDYVIHYLEGKWLEKNEKVFHKIKGLERDELYKGLYSLGIEFDKAILFHKYILLREALGQHYEDALEDLFPYLINFPFDEFLEKFENELHFVTRLKI